MALRATAAVTTAVLGGEETVAAIVAAGVVVGSAVLGAVSAVPVGTSAVVV